MIRGTMGGLGLAACLAAPAAAQQVPPEAFLCEDGRTAFVSFREATAEVAFGRPGAPAATLPIQPTGSGFLYEGPEGSLRGQGEEVTWTEGGAETRCTAVPGGALVGPVWQVVRFRPAGADPEVVPADPASLTLDFGADGRLAARIDCNRGAGSWSAAPAGRGLEGGLTIGPVAVTRAACMGSDGVAERFAAQSGDIAGYVREGDALHLALDAGVWTFAATAPAAD